MTERVFEIERRIAARPDVVFAYFTDPDKYRRWQGVDARLDPRPGGVFRVTITGRSRAVASGVFLEVDPPKRIVFTWGWEPVARVADEALPPGMLEVPPGSSTVEIELPDEGDATLVRLRHRGLPSDVASAFHAGGWTVGVDRLVIAAAGGDPGPDPFEER